MSTDGHGKRNIGMSVQRGGSGQRGVSINGLKKRKRKNKYFFKKRFAYVKKR